MICTPTELNAMDLGTHMTVMEEWNEQHNFGWQDAMVVIAGYYTRVVQADKMGGLYVCTYLTGGEGDLKSLRVYSEVAKNHSGNVAIPELLAIDHKIGHEMWWHSEKEDAEKGVWAPEGA